jgi:hypothetical protein
LPACDMTFGSRFPYAGFVTALVLMVCAGNWAVADSDAPTYVVRFPEFADVGDRYKLTLRAEEELKREILNGEQAEQSGDQFTHVDFEATVEVLAVNSRRQAIKRKYTVHRADAKTNDGNGQLLAPEAVIIAEVGDETNTFTTPEGELLPGMASYVLPRIISFDTSRVTLDDLFGSDTPRRVGETWQADPKLFASQMQVLGEDVNKDDLSSSMTFLSAKEEGRRVLLEFQVNTVVRQSNVPAPPVPQTEVTSGNLHLTQKFTMYHGSTDGPVTHDQTMILRHTLRGKPGTFLADKTMEGMNKEVRNAKFELLPPATP